MSRLTALAAGLLFVLSGFDAAAQTAPIDLSSFYNTLSSGAGASAWGMGGTGIALADAAAGATWNPAAQGRLIRPGVQLAWSRDNLGGAFDTTRFTLASGQTGSITPMGVFASAARLDALQLAFPLRIAGHPLVTGLAYRRRLSLPARTEATNLFRLQSLYRYDYDYAYRASGSGGFDTIGVSFASDLGRGLRIGGTVHRWYGTTSASYRESYHTTVANFYGWDGSWDEHLDDDLQFDVSGFSIDLGAQVQAREKYFAGFVFRSGANLDLDYANAATYQNDHTQQHASATYSGRGSLSLPASSGAGAAVRLHPRLMLAVDYVWTHWSAATIGNYARTTASDTAPEPAAFSYPTRSPASLNAQSNTGRASGGVEYLVAAGSVQIPLRTGASYQQAFDTRGRGAIGMTLGAGLRWRGVALDTAWALETADARYTRHSLCMSAGWTF